MSRFIVMGRNFVVAATSHVAARLLNLALLAIAARTSGLEGVGALAVATAVGTCFLLAADFGLSSRLVREASARPSCEQEEYTRALSLKVVLLPVAIAAAALLYGALSPPRGFALLCALMAVAGTLESFSVLNHAVCRSRERFDLEAVGEMVQAVALFALGGAALVAGLSPGWVGAAAIVAAALELAVSFANVRRFVKPALAWPADVSLLRSSLPYATTSLGLVALAQLDVLVLSLVASRAEIGRYAAVSRLLLGGAYLAGLAADVVLPRAARGYAGDMTGFRRAATEGARVALLVAGAVAVVVVAAAEPVLVLVYGAALASLYPLLQLGAVFLFLKLAGAALRTLLTAAERQSAHARSVVSGLAVAAAAIVLLGERYGAAGAVAALIVGEAAALLVAVVAARELWRAATALPAAATAAAGATVAVAAILLLPAAPPAAAAAGVAVYALSVAVSGEAGRALAFARTAGRPASKSAR